MATAMAATLEQTAVATAMAGAAIAAIAARAATAVASPVTGATATMTRNRLAGAAREGQADDREENRDAQNQCTIHPRILQFQQVPYRKGCFPTAGRPRSFVSPNPDDQHNGRVT